MVRTWYWLIGAGMGAALHAVACTGAREALDVSSAAIACHQRTLAVFSASEAGCLETLKAIEQVIATDPDCVAVYHGAGSGLHCVDHDAGASE